jgi:hypothetical protein
MGIPSLTVLMKRVPTNMGKLIPNMEGEPNFYQIDKQFPLSPPMTPYRSNLLCHPIQMEADASSAASKEHPHDYHASPNHFSSYPGAYGPPPTLYATAYNPQVYAYSHHPSQYPVHYGNQRNWQYPPYNAHPPASPHGITLQSNQRNEQYPHYNAYPPASPHGITFQSNQVNGQNHHYNAYPSASPHGTTIQSAIAPPRGAGIVNCEEIDHPHRVIDRAI